MRLIAVAVTTNKWGDKYMGAITNKRWTRVLLYLLALYVINFIDRNNISFAVIGGMEKDLNMGTAVSGLAGGLFYLGYMILQIPSGIIAEKYDANKLIMLLSVAWGIVALATGFVQTVGQLLILRFLLGLLDGGVWTIILVVLARWFPEKERATSNSIWLMCLPISFIIMGPISGWLISIFNWRMLFVIEAFPAIILGMLFYIYSASRPEEAHWLPGGERDYILAGQQAVSRESAATNYKEAILHPQVLLMSAVYCFWLIGAVGFFMWVPAIIKSLSNQGIVNTGYISTLPYVAALIGLFVLGRMSDRTGQRRQFVSISLFCFGTFLLLSALVTNSLVSLVLLVCSGTFLFATHAPFWAMPVAMFPPRLRGAAMGMISLIGNIGSFIGPYVVGFVRETTGSFTSGMLVLVISLWIAAFLTTKIKMASQVVSPSDSMNI